MIDSRCMFSQQYTYTTSSCHITRIQWGPHNTANGDISKWRDTGPATMAPYRKGESAVQEPMPPPPHTHTLRTHYLCNASTMPVEIPALSLQVNHQPKSSPTQYNHCSLQMEPPNPLLTCVTINPHTTIGLTVKGTINY